MPEESIQPQDEFYQLRNGVFNLVVTLFQEQEKVRGRTWAKTDVVQYLESLAHQIKTLDEDSDREKESDA